MTRKSFDELLSDGLEALADEARTPPDVAARALARARRRVPLRLAGVAAALGAASVLAAVLVVRPAPLFDGGGSAVGDGSAGAGGCKPALVASYLTATEDGSAPTANVYDWQADRCGTYAQTRYAWAVDNYERVAVLGRAGDPRGPVPAAPGAARELGILNQGNQTARWVTLPAPAWAAFWSPDYGRAIVASLVRRGAHGEAVFSGYVIVDPRTATVRKTVELDEPALTPFQWTPDSRHVVAAFRDGLRFLDLNGRVTHVVSARGTIPVPAAVSPEGERILVQPPGRSGSGRYLVVSVADGRVLERINGAGTVLGWLCGDALLAVDHGKKATELLAFDLVPPRGGPEPPLETFGPEVDTVIPRLDMLYRDCPGVDPRTSPGDRRSSGEKE